MTIIGIHPTMEHIMDTPVGFSAYETKFRDEDQNEISSEAFEVP